MQFGLLQNMNRLRITIEKRAVIKFCKIEKKLEKMNRIILAAIIIAMAFAGCKSKKQLAQSPYTTDPAAQQKVFTVPASDTQPAAPAQVKEEPVQSTEPVSMRKEQVSFTNQED